MNIVSLTNPGLIPMEAVTTMGVSAKEGENPIGFFGTGLKYAVASLLRTSHKITIWRGMERYDFKAAPGQVRGKDFDFIVMTGPEGEERLGFTTHLGAHWEMWQVFRELYSNCLDEGGDLSFTRAGPEEGQTTIWVTGAAFADAARDRQRYFLTTKPLYSGMLADVHPGASSGLYYRGVLVAALNRPSAFTYNITTSVTLTEDRTLKERFYADSYIGNTLGHCTDPAILERALTNREGYEETLGFHDPQPTFAELALDLCERRGIAAVLPRAVGAAEAWAQKEARVKPLTLSPRDAVEMEEAKAFLASMGYPITAPIVLAETLGPGIAGMAKNETIYIARQTINRGGNYLIGTLLEEHLHITQGFADESRAFQDFLIDLVVRLAKGGPAPVWTPKPDQVREAAPPPPVPALVDEIPF